MAARNERRIQASVRAADAVITSTQHTIEYVDDSSATPAHGGALERPAIAFS